MAPLPLLFRYRYLPKKTTKRPISGEAKHLNFPDLHRTMGGSVQKTILEALFKPKFGDEKFVMQEA